MRNVLIFLLGRPAIAIDEVIIDGVEWYSAQQVCYRLGITDVSSTMRRTDAIISWNGNDKCKRRVVEINRHSDVWLVSMSGIWKLMLCCPTVQSDRFRAWLATRFLPPLIQGVAERPGVAEAGYNQFL